MDERTREIALLQRQAANLGRAIARVAAYVEDDAMKLTSALASVVSSTCLLAVIQAEPPEVKP